MRKLFLLSALLFCPNLFATCNVTTSGGTAITAMHTGDSYTLTCTGTGYTFQPVTRFPTGTVTTTDISGNFTVTYGSARGPGSYDDTYTIGGGGFSYRVLSTILSNTTPVTVGVVGMPTDVNYGTWFNLTFVCRDPDGYADISSCRVIVGWAINDNYTCDLIWYAGNTIGNYNGSSFQNQTPGTGGAVADNSYCTLDIANSSVTLGGTDVTVVARIRPKPAMLVSGGSSLASWMFITDTASATAGWTQLGSTGTLRSGPKLIVTQNR